MRGRVHLFSPAGREALREALAGPVLVAFDFDGTLAPIVDHPDLARVPAELAEPLAVLARRWPVAVVTGRSIADVRPRLGFEPRHLIGNHGAEGLALPGSQAAHAALAPLRRRLRRQRARLDAAGVTVEDKGRSLALHYRTAPEPEAARQAIDAALAGQTGVLRFGGKCVENVVAAGAPDKGDAVAALAEREAARAVVFVGDDVNDEAVFRRALPGWVTVRIGREAVPTAARFVLDDPDEMRTMLALMLTPDVGVPDPC